MDTVQLSFVAKEDGWKLNRSYEGGINLCILSHSDLS